jgi:hypothetical protein
MRKNESLLMFFLVLLLTGVSCNEDETSFHAECDVYTFTRYDSEGYLEYGNLYYVYANKSMDDVSVTTPNNNTITLAACDGSTSTFYKDTDDEDYSKTPPITGTYSFNILTSKNEEVKISDQLENSFAMPVDITKANIENDVLDLEWNDNANAYIFSIKKISDNTEKQLFLCKNFLVKTSYSIDTSDLSSELIAPSEGEEYVIEVLAYKFESGVGLTLAYNIQSISFAKATITWQ